MKLKSIWSLSAGIMLLGGSAMAEGNIKFSEFTLPNGLHVILHEDHSTPIVAVSVMYHVGSKNEDPQRTGFAHFFEHLLFEGSDNIKRGEYMGLVQGNGGQLNANTSQDRTFYYEVLPSNQLELGLWMESERMLHAKIDQVGIETQRKVVKEEKKQRYDNTPYGQLINTVFENGFTVHPYRWSPIGKDQYIDQATMDEFMNFYKTFYVPNNAVLVIGGDFDKKQAGEMILKYFKDIPKGTKEIPRPKEVEPAQTAEKRVNFYDNIQLPAVILAYHAPKQGTEDYYALQLLSQLLSQGNSSRFRSQIVEKQQRAVEVGAFNLPSEDPGVVVMFGIVNAGITPNALEESMTSEVDRVKNDLISEEEYNKLLNQAESQFVSQNQHVRDVVDNLATYYTFMGDANLINTELDRYRKVSREDLQRVARKYFTRENRLVVDYLPKSEEKK